MKHLPSILSRQAHQNRAQLYELLLAIVCFNADKKIKDIILSFIFCSRCPVTADIRGMKSSRRVERCMYKAMELSLTVFIRMKQKLWQNCFLIYFSKQNAIAMSVTSCKLCNSKRIKQCRQVIKTKELC